MSRALTSQDLTVVDIRDLTARDLDALLLEETADWRRQLDWDFSKFAALVRKFADARMLTGAALADSGEIVGYGHTCLQGAKALITDLYVRPAWRTQNSEAALLLALLNGLIAKPAVRRVEGQLMLLGTDTVRAVQREPRVRFFERLLMNLDAHTPLPPGRASTQHRFRIDTWSPRHLDAAAEVVAAGHIGHIETQVNDQYRSFQGARRLLCDIVQFPGFHQPASFIAIDMTTGSAAGMLLSSFIAREVGQITELCVTPNARGAGLGYELLRRSAANLRNSGAKRVSLTVTAHNEEAVGLYTRCGFQPAHSFSAFVWEAV